MEASSKIGVEVQGNQVTIVGRFGNSITFLGSSCAASVHPGQKIDSFTLSPGEDEGVIAIKTGVWESHGKYGDWKYGHFLFLISRRDKKPWVDLGKTFVPTEGRVGQIVLEVGLSVCIGDEFFLAPLLVSEHHSEEKLAELKKKYRLVSTENANLLCRFIASKASAEDVRAAADELVIQTVDVPALQAKLVEAEQQIKRLEETNQVLEAKYRLSSAQISEMARRISEASHETSWMTSVVRKLRSKLPTTPET